MWPNYKLIEAYQIAKINNLIFQLLKNVYNMFNRKYVEIEYSPLFESPYNFAATVWSPLDSGILSGKYVSEIPKDSRFDEKGKGHGQETLGSEHYVNKQKNEKVVN